MEFKLAALWLRCVCCKAKLSDDRAVFARVHLLIHFQLKHFMFNAKSHLTTRFIKKCSPWIKPRWKVFSRNFALSSTNTSKENERKEQKAGGKKEKKLQTSIVDSKNERKILKENTKWVNEEFFSLFIIDEALCEKHERYVHRSGKETSLNYTRKSFIVFYLLSLSSWSKSKKRMFVWLCKFFPNVASCYGGEGLMKLKYKLCESTVQRPKSKQLHQQNVPCHNFFNHRRYRAVGGEKENFSSDLSTRTMVIDNLIKQDHYLLFHLIHNENSTK